jgi:hypothetical protein
MKGLNAILCLALLSALPCAAQEPFVIVDQQNDVALTVEDGDGLNFATVTFTRKSLSKIEIDFRMNGAVPKTTRGDYVIIAYLDIDNNPNTGLSRGDISTDVNIFAFKAPGTGQWECKIDKTSSLLAKESFQVAKFSQYKDGFTIDVSAPLFKKLNRMRGYVESISGGKALDRVPAEDFFTWDETKPLLPP